MVYFIKETLVRLNDSMNQIDQLSESVQKISESIRKLYKEDKAVLEY